MKLWFSLFLCTLYVSVFAQQKEVSGIVFDKENKTRIAKVKVVNITSKQSVYNNLKGEFSIKTSVGDVLIFSKADHYADTIKITAFTPLAIYMRPVAIQLKQVTVRDTALSPEKRLASIKSQFSRIYGPSPDGIVVSPGVGVGIGIDALYNMFSKSGRNARHLQEVIDWDYKQTVIDYRFNKTFVASITKLKEPQLTDFMQKYRPGYYQVTTAQEYEFIASIRNNAKRYLRNPGAFELAPLPAVPLPDTTK
jgi:co-chaperonin GroES (HSP10)